MSKTGSNYPSETRNITILAQRIKKDLTWIVVSVAVALAAATGTYMAITK
ncbi:hypothetical protein [Desulfallas thermosapovorans]|uniref:Uncharacterized protein n=1 Tax=Desulfallas thermosapovorans DSM 6562 TaxID=1121431 RepID=A0A5S4ZNZ2_9FIRM|nr:hypothetical protein [Desulfallas thermosapovorans]TYO93859.1 hypothetical protein LX24_02539 [Desulfallas thermosapovorans DSM 6562]